MQTALPTRLLLLATASLLGAATLSAQTAPSHMHPSKPAAGTPAASALSPAAPTPAPPETPARRPAQRAELRFDQGLLSINANNSSLNQILREIGRLTGMKISGGVAEERVFGFYGPSPARNVLAALLEGTGSNMLLLQSSTDAPAELLLTPRLGGATPPNPDAQASDDNDIPPQQMGARPFPVQAPQQPAQTPVQPPPLPQLQPQQETRIQDTPNPPPAAAVPSPAVTTPAPGDATQQQSPNGVKTPQQIYEQLLKMQQKQPR